MRLFETSVVLPPCSVTFQGSGLENGGRHGKSISYFVGQVLIRQHCVRRKEICADHVHPLPIHGIYGRQEDGARSVVLTGKSEFQDEDQGDTLYVQFF